MFLRQLDVKCLTAIYFILLFFSIQVTPSISIKQYNVYIYIYVYIKKQAELLNPLWIKLTQ